MVPSRALRSTALLLLCLSVLSFRHLEVSVSVGTRLALHERNAEPCSPTSSPSTYSSPSLDTTNKRTHPFAFTFKPKSLLAAAMLLPTLLLNTDIQLVPGPYHSAPPLSITLSSAARADDELAKYAAEGNPVGVNGLCFVKKCALETSSCAADQSCLKGLSCLARCKGGSMCSTGCFAKYGSEHLDNLLSCSVERNNCVEVPGQGEMGWTADRLADLPAKPLDTFQMQSLDGSWYKIMGLDSRYDCFDCQKNKFQYKSTGTGSGGGSGGGRSGAKGFSGMMTRAGIKAGAGARAGTGMAAVAAAAAVGPASASDAPASAGANGDMMDDGAARDKERGEERIEGDEERGREGVLAMEALFRVPRPTAPGYLQSKINEELHAPDPRVLAEGGGRLRATTAIPSMQSRGKMFGLTFWENWYILSEGAARPPPTAQVGAGVGVGAGAGEQAQGWDGREGAGGMSARQGAADPSLFANANTKAFSTANYGTYGTPMIPLISSIPPVLKSIPSREGPPEPPDNEMKLVYYTGHTLQGSYKGAFLYARSPEITPETLVVAKEVISRGGLNIADFCLVRNACFLKSDTPAVRPGPGGLARRGEGHVVASSSFPSTSSLSAAGQEKAGTSPQQGKGRAGVRPGSGAGAWQEYSMRSEGEADNRVDVKAPFWYVGQNFFRATESVARELSDWFEDPAMLSDWLVQQQQRMVFLQPLEVSPFGGDVSASFDD